MQEVWKKIKGFPDYDISNKGRVLSFKNIVPILLAPSDSSRYYHVFLRHQGLAETKRIHNLVLDHFGPPKPTPFHVCRHLKNNPKHNWITVLGWGTQQENIDDKKKHGTQPSGAKIYCARLNNNQVLMIRFLHRRGVSISTIANKYGVTTTIIGRVVRNETYKNVQTRRSKQ